MRMLRLRRTYTRSRASLRLRIRRQRHRVHEGAHGGLRQVPLPGQHGAPGLGPDGDPIVLGRDPKQAALLRERLGDERYNVYFMQHSIG